MQSMLEFGGLLKHEKTQHALVGLGNAALVAAVVRRPEFPERDNTVYKRKKKRKELGCDR